MIVKNGNVFYLSLLKKYLEITLRKVERAIAVPSQNQAEQSLGAG